MVRKLGLAMQSTVTQLLRRPRPTWWPPLAWGWPAGLVAIGVALRFGWALTEARPSLLIGEANNVALSFARSGTLADAFRLGEGPTAHLGPTMPVIAGSVYWLFTPGSPVSDMVLTALSVSFVAVAWVALYRAFGRLGVPRAARLSALAILTVVPINASLEAVQFRVWEGGLAAALAATFLDHVVYLDRAARISTRSVAALALHAAVTLFVSPPLGLAALAGCALLLIRRVPPRRWPALTGVILAILVAVLLPWTVRNVLVMGTPIMFRDNFGLEMSQAFYAGAEQPGDPLARFQARHHAIHPFQPAGYAAMQAAGGEVPYAAALQHEAQAWIAANPLIAAQLAVQHIVDFYFPPRWLWTQFGRVGTATTAKLVLTWAISLFGLLGLWRGAAEGGGRFGYVAAFALLPSLPYALVQPTLRYHYLVLGVLTFAATALAARFTAPPAVPKGADRQAR